MALSFATVELVTIFVAFERHEAIKQATLAMEAKYVFLLPRSTSNADLSTMSLAVSTPMAMSAIRLATDWWLIMCVPIVFLSVAYLHNFAATITWNNV